MMWHNEATFICGHRKSGTTLLLNMLDSHPQLCVFPADSGFFYDYYPHWDSDDYSPLDKVERFVNVFYGNLISDLPEEHENIDLNDLGLRFAEKVNGDYSSCNMLLSGILTYYDVMQMHLPERWVEKTTSSEIYADKITSWFPNAKFIHVLRDPRDNFASLFSGWERRYKKFNKSVNNLLQSMIDRGILSFMFADLNMCRYGEKYKVVRFEDLTSQPEQTVRGICDFLNIDYSDILLKPTYCGMPWHGNNFDGLVFHNVSHHNVGRWSERISPHQAAVVEAYFCGFMKKWEYPFAFSEEERAKALAEHYVWFNATQR